MADKTSKQISDAVNDSLTNLTTGLGTDRDKNMYTQFADFVQLDDVQLLAAYRGDWIARKVVDIPAHDATRRWRAWQADNEQIEMLEAEEKRLGLRRKVRAAMKWGRLFGGGALIMGIPDDDPAKPLDKEKGIRQGALKYVHAVTRRQLTAGELEDDISLEIYGVPRDYTVNTKDGGITKIHCSRVVRFVGNELPDPDLPSQTPGWGDSVLQAVEDAIKQASGASSGIATLIHEAKIDVIKLPGLMDKVADPQYRERVLERYKLANVSKSFINSLLLDAEEEWERIVVNFASLPDVLKLYLLIAAGAADIPATRMLGQSPLGMNSTGESDMRNYYDRIEADQEDDLSPAIATLDEMLIWSTFGSRDKNIYYEWNELWQMDDAQRAELASKKAATHQVDVGLGLIDPEALRIARQNQLIEDGFYPGFEAALEEAEKLAAAAEVPEDDDEVNAQFQESMQQQMGGEPDEEEEEEGVEDAAAPYRLLRVDAFDADGDEADFNFVGEDGNFSGYAVRWNATYHDGFRVQRGAFLAGIEEFGDKVPLLYQHKIELVIGQVVLSEDATGLRVDGQLNMDLDLAKEVKSNIQKNVLNGLSIGYVSYRTAPGDKKLIVEIPIEEVSVVTFPSMAEATIDAMTVADMAAMPDDELRMWVSAAATRLGA